MKDKILEVIQNYQLSKVFMWTPKQIKELTFDERMCYLSLLNGESKE